MTGKLAELIRLFTVRPKNGLKFIIMNFIIMKENA